MGRKEILKDDQKLKFIEVLLIVGAILSAFNLPQGMIWMFMLFILAGLFIYAGLQGGIKSVFWYNILVGILSLCFAAVFTFLFAFSFIQSFNVAPSALITIVFVYLFCVSYAIYFFLSKPFEGGIISMWERFRRYFGPFTITGAVVFAIGVALIGYALYILVTNNEEIRWSDYLAMGLASISVGIAFISLGISTESTRRLEHVTDSDYVNFIDSLENERLKFIDEAARLRGVKRFMIEVLAWKSKQYFGRAINLREFVIDKSNLRFLANYLKQLTLVLFQQAIKQKWIDKVWNRDVHNLVKMYAQLWETGAVAHAEEKIKNELIGLFETYIGERKPGEDDLTFFRRVQVEIGKKIEKKEQDKPFNKIILEKEPGQK